MTRLTEALERARATSVGATPRLVPRSEEIVHRSGARGPSAWQFDEDIPVAAETRPVEIPACWDIDDLRIVADEAAPDASEAQQAPTDELRQAPTGEVRQTLLKLRESLADLDRLEIRSAHAGKLVVGGSAEPYVVEQYRSIAAALHHAQLQTGARVLMVSSAVEGEGKTLTSTNLALTLSHSYQRRVLLIDADLRRPAVHQLLRLDNTTGLGDTLKRNIPDGRLPVQRVLPTLWVITAGHPDPDPMSGLVSDTMKDFLVEAVEQFDWIVIDTPPIAVLPDANLLAAMVDTALLVVSAGTTPLRLVNRAIDAIGRARILGVVLNRAEGVTLGYDEHTYTYGQRPSRPSWQSRFGWLGRKGRPVVADLAFEKRTRA